MVRFAVWKTENTGTVHVPPPEEPARAISRRQVLSSRICSWAAVVRGDRKGDPALWVWIGVPE